MHFNILFISIRKQNHTEKTGLVYLPLKMYKSAFWVTLGVWVMPQRLVTLVSLLSTCRASMADTDPGRQDCTNIFLITKFILLLLLGNSDAFSVVNHSLPRNSFELWFRGTANSCYFYHRDPYQWWSFSRTGGPPAMQKKMVNIIYLMI